MQLGAASVAQTAESGWHGMHRRARQGHHCSEPQPLSYKGTSRVRLACWLCPNGGGKLSVLLLRVVTLLGRTILL